MGLLTKLKAALAPAKLTTSSAEIVGEKPLWEQFQRIGGGLTPADVSRILTEADAGYPQRLVDLFNESRQKDGHLQSACWTRESAVALCEVMFVEPPDGSKRRDQKAVDLCKRIVAEFDNWTTLVEHLTSSCFPGHATDVIEWVSARDGALLPKRAKPVHPRDFIYAREDGSLRYQRHTGDSVGVDLAAEFPGRIVQLIRRINGDALAREGLQRVLVWPALFRNWDLRDWIAFAEVGWKPWRIGQYVNGTDQREIEKFLRMLERIGSNGTGVHDDKFKLDVRWPNGFGSFYAHQNFFDYMGREISKAVLGQTSSIEAGPNGDRAATQTRDQIRLDIRESDAVAVAAALRAHLFAPAVAVNLGERAIVPVPWFQTDESTDTQKFADAVLKLSQAGVRIPQKWVRDEVGAPEPDEGEEVIGVSAQVPGPDASDGDEEPEEEAA